MNVVAAAGSKYVEWLEIDEQADGQRIDNFLINHLKGVPKSFIYRVLRRGEVRVNKGRVKPDYRLQSGDVVRVPPLRRPDATTLPPPGRHLIEVINNSVLYEDSGLLIINKPPGVAVHGGSGVNHGIIAALRSARPDTPPGGAVLGGWGVNPVIILALRCARPDTPGLELVHRLDRDTSGCLMIAKKRSTLRALHALLREESGVDKRYVALLQGRWRGGGRRAAAPMKKNVLSSGERSVRVDEEGKAAETRVRPLRRYAMASLVEAAPLTGRTHQIRVHAVHLGHAIAGDEKYGDETFNAAMKGYGLRRLFLHAASLRFHLPNSEQAIEVQAPLSAELEHTLTALVDD